MDNKKAAVLLQVIKDYSRLKWFGKSVARIECNYLLHRLEHTQRPLYLIIEERIDDLWIEGILSEKQQLFYRERIVFLKKIAFIIEDS